MTSLFALAERMSLTRVKNDRQPVATLSSRGEPFLTSSRPALKRESIKRPPTVVLVWELAIVRLVEMWEGVGVERNISRSDGLLF